MKYRNHRIRKPDPLLALAVLVGIGVVVTTTVQAETTAATRAKLQEKGARLMLHPVKGLADNLELNWLNSALDRPAVQQFADDNRMQLAKPFGRKGPTLDMSIRPDLTQEVQRAGDAGVGDGVDEEWQPDVYFSLRRSW